VRFQGLEFRAERVAGRRITSVLIVPAPRLEEDDDDAESAVRAESP
jgi:hypothetical protein